MHMLIISINSNQIGKVKKLSVHLAEIKYLNVMLEISLKIKKLKRM